MKIIGAIFCGDELPLIKYVMPYIINFGFDKLYIYSNSTDGSSEAIEKYNLDFIEIRRFEAFSDYFKAETYINLFFELKKESIETNEEIWFYKSDFDEVVFTPQEPSLKNVINGFDFYKECNYYANKMTNLVYKPSSQIGLSSAMEIEKTEFCHALSYIYGFSWPYYGTKVTFFRVNDFKITNCFFSAGEHILSVQLEDGKTEKNLADIGLYYSFHLKYLTEEIFLERSKKWDKTVDVSKSAYRKATSCIFPLSHLFYSNYEKYGYRLGDIGGITTFK